MTERWRAARLALAACIGVVVPLGVSCVNSKYGEVADCVEPSPAARECPVECMRRDGADRCIRWGDCQTDLDCPSGTECSADLVASCPVSTCCGDASTRACLAVSAPRSLAGALTGGLGVPKFSFRQTSADGAPATFAFTAPLTTQEVRCAVFVCRPEFAATECYGGEPVMYISNLEPCAALQTQMRIISPSGDEASGLFDISGLPLPDAFGDAHLSSIVAGCWSYDIAGVSGATTMLPLTVSQVPQLGPFIPSSCEPNINTLNCFPSENGGIGSCARGSCRPRCARTEDCDSAQRCCREAETDDLGACFPVDDNNLPLFCDFHG